MLFCVNLTIMLEYINFVHNIVMLGSGQNATKLLYYVWGFNMY